MPEGQFDTIGGVAANNIACWNDTVWSACVASPDGAVVEELAVFKDRLVAGFADLLGDVRNTYYLASWDGESWSGYDSGVNRDVLVAASWRNRLIVGGYFNVTDGKEIPYIAAWVYEDE